MASLTEEERERRRQHGRWLVREVITPEAWARSQRAEIRKRVGQLNAERKIGWCPISRREEYFRLVRSLRYSAAEARAIIEADLAREHRRPKSFEDKLRAVEAGAPLVARRQIRRPDPLLVRTSLP